MSTLIALAIKIALFLVALRKLWDYILKSNLVNIFMFIVAAHQAGKKKENGSSKRSRGGDAKASNSSSDRLLDSKPKPD